jgi:hypothetical protein
MTNQNTSTAVSSHDENPAPDTASPVPGNAHEASNVITSDLSSERLSQYHWVPVLKKRRVDGWSPEKQRSFIEALADTGSVLQAAMSVGMTDRTAYALRRAPDAHGFDQAWTIAVNTAGKRLLDEAFERALVGSDEPVFNRDGERVGRRFRKSDRMLQFLLRSYYPDRFGAQPSHATGQGAGLDEQSSATMGVADAIVQMLPEPPAEPHLLTSPEELDAALEIADMADGDLPHWHRDPQPFTHSPRDAQIEDTRDKEHRDNVERIAALSSDPARNNPKRHGKGTKWKAKKRA